MINYIAQCIGFFVLFFVTATALGVLCMLVVEDLMKRWLLHKRIWLAFIEFVKDRPI
jgi:hypothetical protein